MPALLDLPSPTALDTRPPAVREWETCADYYEGPIGETSEKTTSAMSIAQDERIGNLIAENCPEPEPLMGSMQRDLRRGDRLLATRLITIVRDEALDASIRALALETLAGARVRTLDQELRDIIREVIERRNVEMQFSAVAAASDLSRQSQVLLAGIIRELAQAGKDYWVQRAARAFLASL